MALKLSVAMATFNGQQYLAEQLDSILTQTRLPDEMVICDDASTDLTYRLLNQFKERAPFVVRLIVNPTNLGHALSFSNAIEQCNGDLISLCDQDDVWYSSKLAEVEACFHIDHELILVVHNSNITSENLSRSGFTTFGQVRALGKALQDSIFAGCLMTFRSEVVKIAIPIPHNRPQHDVWLNEVVSLLVSKEKWRSHYIQVPLMSHRRHASTATSHVASRPLEVTLGDRWLDFLQAKLRQIQYGLIPASQRLQLMDAQIALLRLIMLRGEALLKESHYQVLNERFLVGRLKEWTKSIALLERRLELLKKNRLQKISGAFRLWYQGDYKSIAGVFSLLRDALGP